MSSREFAGYVRNFIFGVEDSLVSTIGLVAGVAAAGIGRSTILLTGIVLIFVEAFSMAAGSYLSEHAAEEHTAGEAASHRYSLISSAIMFLSYFVSGFIPLGPYLLTTSERALPLSISLSLIALFILGFATGSMLKTNAWKSAFRMLAIGGIAIGIGVIVGRWVKS